MWECNHFLVYKPKRHVNFQKLWIICECWETGSINKWNGAPTMVRKDYVLIVAIIDPLISTWKQYSGQKM